MESDARVSLLNLLSWNITLYGPLIIIVIGTIGCVCNFITFTSIKLRKNSCSFYFFVAAIFDLLTLDFGALTRLLGDHFGLAVYHQLRVYCKIRQYLVNILPALATLFIVLAAMDRFVSTSSKLVYRSWATIPYARRIAMISSIIWMASYLHYPFQAELRPTCLLPQGVYGTFAVVYSIVWTSIFPHALMLGFGYGTYYHICQTRRRAVAANSQQRRTYRTEKQLVTMTLFQVGISSMLILTRIAYFSYSTITSATTKSDYQRALDNFFSQLTTQLFYLNYAKSFYVYTLSSKFFRRIFVETIFKLARQLTCRRALRAPRIHPANNNRPLKSSLQTGAMLGTTGRS